MHSINGEKIRNVHKYLNENNKVCQMNKRQKRKDKKTKEHTEFT